MDGCRKDLLWIIDLKTLHMTEKPSRSGASSVLRRDSLQASDDSQANLDRGLELLVHRLKVFTKPLETSLQRILSGSETRNLARDLMVKDLAFLKIKRVRAPGGA